MSDSSSSPSASVVSLWDGRGRRAAPVCILSGLQRGSLKKRLSWKHTRDTMTSPSEVWKFLSSWITFTPFLFLFCLCLVCLHSPVSKCRERTSVMTPSYICKLLRCRHCRHRLGAAAWRYAHICVLHLNPIPPLAAWEGRDAVKATPHLPRSAPALFPSFHLCSVTMTMRCLACKPPQRPQRCQSPVGPCLARRRRMKWQRTPRCFHLPARLPLDGSRMRWPCCSKRHRSNSGRWRWLTGSRRGAESSPAPQRLHWWKPEKLFASWTLTEEVPGRWAVTDPRRPSYSAPAYHTETWAKPANERARFRTFTYCFTLFDRLWCSASVGWEWKCWIKKQKRKM